MHGHVHARNVLVSVPGELQAPFPPSFIDAAAHAGIGWSADRPAGRRSVAPRAQRLGPAARSSARNVHEEQTSPTRGGRACTADQR